MQTYARFFFSVCSILCFPCSRFFSQFASECKTNFSHKCNERKKKAKRKTNKPSFYSTVLLCDAKSSLDIRFTLLFLNGFVWVLFFCVKFFLIVFENFYLDNLYFGCCFFGNVYQNVFFLLVF